MGRKHHPRINWADHEAPPPAPEGFFNVQYDCAQCGAPALIVVQASQYSDGEPRWCERCRIQPLAKPPEPEAWQLGLFD